MESPHSGTLPSVCVMSMPDEGHLIKAIHASLRPIGVPRRVCCGAKFETARAFSG